MSRLIRIINPNSNRAVSAAMSEAVEPLRAGSEVEIVVETLTDGPLGIESDEHVEQVIPLLCDLVERDSRADAFVIGCYSDPGLSLCRRRTGRPVLGIAESAALLAAASGRRFGVISILPESVPRHWRHLESRRLEHHCAGDRPVGLSVAEVESGSDTFDRLVEVGTMLRDEDGAGAIVLGCTGMARHQAALQARLGVPVIEPTRAATSLALACLG
ncbi:MAG: Asp/Glu racemase [Gammaproteobacteria bacterium]|nr:Asp/Glu racemase [Gammaproteobacteria bacterium]